MYARLEQYWVYGGFLAGVLMLILLPVRARDSSSALVVVFLQLPVYMLHQYEEHDDRFRLFVNRMSGGGKEVLSHQAVFTINVSGVWGVIDASFSLAFYISIGYGLIAIYLTLVNAVAHIGAAVASHSYNPGLATAALLFVPVGVFGFRELQQTGEVGWHHQLLGFLIAVVYGVGGACRDLHSSLKRSRYCS
jgi:hypothetical protein